MSSASGFPEAHLRIAQPIADHPGAAVTAQDGSVIATVSRYVRLTGPGGTASEVVVCVRGDLDIDTAPLVQETLIRSLDGAERVCLDLAEVGFCGAAGVGAVITARQHAAALGRGLRLSGVHGLTERVLTLTGLYPEA
jgi:anti-sigma B factor antagonist